MKGSLTLTQWVQLETNKHKHVCHQKTELGFGTEEGLMLTLIFWHREESYVDTDISKDNDERQ